MKIVAFILIVFISTASFGQVELNTMLLMNGKKVRVQNYSCIMEQTRKVIYTDSAGNHFKTNPDNIFSVTDNTGCENMFYVPDSAKEGNVSTENMRFYVLGQHDALNINREGFIWAGGFGLGTVAPVFLGFYGPLASALYITGVGIYPVDNIEVKSNSPFAKDDFYVEGYRSKIQEKRMKKSLTSSGIGLVLGFIIYFAAKK